MMSKCLYGLLLVMDIAAIYSCSRTESKNIYILCVCLHLTELRLLGGVEVE